MAIIKRQQVTSAGENVEKREPSYTLGGIIDCCSHNGKHYEGSLKIKNKVAVTQREKKKTIQKNGCTSMFTAALFTIARSWKQPKCPLTDEWIKKMWPIYTMEYYSAIK